MKRMFLYMLAVICSAECIHAQSFVIYCTDGTKTEYKISKVEKIEFNDEFATDSTYNGHQYVDLGLPSRKLWATCNIGASTPIDYGSYFAWGETEAKTYFAKENCSTYGKSQGNSISGTEYDAAKTIWGGNWRIPTKEEFSELTAKCTWTRYSANGILCIKGVGPNGNTIIIPANGWINGYNNNNLNEDLAYWLSEQESQNSGYMLWGIRTTNTYFTVSNGNAKYLGQGIRPICTSIDE